MSVATAEICAPSAPLRTGWHSRAQHAYEYLTEQDAVELTTRLTLVMVLLFPGDLWYHQLYMRMLTVAGLIWPGLARRPLFWFVLAALNLGVQNLYNWALSDNHKWLYSYWFLALGVGLRSSDPRAALALNGRLLVGLAFLFAVLRKVSFTEYLSGASFQFLLLADSRFSEVARLLGHTQAPGPMYRAMATLEPGIALPSGPVLATGAAFLTWWTLAIELAVAVLFLLTRPARVARWRNYLLLLFVATTYPVAPVLGFGWILLILGLAQCRHNFAKTRLVYLLGFVGITAFQGEFLKIKITEWMLPAGSAV